MERALVLSTNNVEALKAKARALIYSGQYAEGRKLANRIMRLDPAALAEPLYLIGISHFGSGSYDKAVDYIERALENDATTIHYYRLLTAAYGKLGMEKEAKQAWDKFRETWTGPQWIAAVVYFYPFEDGEILKHLADGFMAAGAVVRPPSRYLKLDRETRLSGQEIKTLLVGHTIKGRDYWRGTGWGQKRTIDGKVSHFGEPIHIGIPIGNQNVNEGESWIEDERLCNRWSEVEVDITTCVLIFRDFDGDENDFYMVTDIGPSPFRVSN